MTGLTIPKTVESRAFSQHKLRLENPCWTITAFALIYLWKMTRRNIFESEYAHTHTTSRVERRSERNEMKFIMLSDQSLGVSEKPRAEKPDRRRLLTHTHFSRYRIQLQNHYEWYKVIAIPEYSRPLFRNASRDLCDRSASGRTLKELSMRRRHRKHQKASVMLIPQIVSSLRAFWTEIPSGCWMDFVAMSITWAAFQRSRSTPTWSLVHI